MSSRYWRSPFQWFQLLVFAFRSRLIEAYSWSLFHIAAHERHIYGKSSSSVRIPVVHSSETPPISTLTQSLLKSNISVAMSTPTNCNLSKRQNDFKKMVDVAAPLVGDSLSYGDMDASMTTATSSGSTMYTSQMEEDEDYPKSLQEELNEVLEAWYELLSEEDIRQYQKYLEDISNKKLAEGALQTVGAEAPDWELPDQDGDPVNLDELCQKGPVVLVFYRGKWCPHCNIQVREMQKILPKIEAMGAQLVCISPMLPDGTQYMSTKMQLGFPIVSDVGNKTAKDLNIAFAVHPDVRESMVKWGEDLPKFNGDFTWEIPLAATYIISKGDRKIVWSFIDNDPGVRAEPAEILANIPKCADNADGPVVEDKDNASLSRSSSKRDKHNRGTGYATAFKKLKGSLKNSLKGSKKKLFGKKKLEAKDFLMTKFP